MAVSAYDTNSVNSLLQLGSNINRTTTFIDHLEGCGYTSTTEAINSGATVTAGSACSSADETISTNLTGINTNLEQTTAAFTSSRSSTEATSTQVLAAFTDFANAYYALFNAMDLAECTYKLTTSSQSFAAQFGKGALKDSFDGLVSELSSDLVMAVELLGPNLKQQTHFAGTSLLATQVDGYKVTALAGCNLITSIVESEGGGSS